jgi:hypothetical protein
VHPMETVVVCLCLLLFMPNLCPAETCATPDTLEIWTDGWAHACRPPQPWRAQAACVGALGCCPAALTTCVLICEIMSPAVSTPYGASLCRGAG